MDVFAVELHRSNEDKRAVDREQRLVDREEETWRPFDDIESNFGALCNEARRRPGELKIHLSYLLYAIIVLLRDVMAIRMSCVYDTVLCSPDEVSQHVSCLVLDVLFGSAYFVFNQYKTSDCYGSVRVEIPSELVSVLVDSFQRFPRRYLFTVLRDMHNPMSQNYASDFVRNSWILGGPRPTFNNIRSASATRFFRLNPDLISREEFAHRSTVSLDTMFKNYVKIRDGRFLS